jgi:hypothetical protein
MRRFLAAVLSSSLPLLAVAPAQASPSRLLQYSVVATSGGYAHRATVTVDIIGGSAERVMNVNVDGMPLGIEPSGSLLGGAGHELTSEEDAICSLMSLESEDLAGVSTGDHWDREGPVPGGRHHTRYSVLGVNDEGFVQFAVSRDLQRRDGSVARWHGTMLYDSEAFVPSTIALNGDVSDDSGSAQNVALTIHLIHDSFKHY